MPYLELDDSNDYSSFESQWPITNPLLLQVYISKTGVISKIDISYAYYRF
jgi:hypothetical protein